MRALIGANTRDALRAQLSARSCKGSRSPKKSLKVVAGHHRKRETEEDELKACRAVLATMSNATPTITELTPNLPEERLLDFDMLLTDMSPDFMLDTYPHFNTTAAGLLKRSQSSRLRSSMMTVGVPCDVRSDPIDFDAMAIDETLKSRTPPMKRRQQASSCDLLRWASTRTPPQAMRTTHAHHQSIMG